jgi:hypothetical protein
LLGVSLSEDPGAGSPKRLDSTISGKNSLQKSVTLTQDGSVKCFSPRHAAFTIALAHSVRGAIGIMLIKA